jgi:hypothetical protein
MRCRSQSQLAWGEGDSAASRVVVCGLRDIHARGSTLSAVRCSRWVLEVIRRKRSESRAERQVGRNA